MAPKDVNKYKQTQVWINLCEKRFSNKRRKQSKFSPMDLVRLSMKKTLFVKRGQ